MYLPEAFQEADLRALDALVGRDGFITLVTVADGSPQVSHLPVLYYRDGHHVTLHGHFARPNPQARQGGRALAIVHGPHAYVSPSWYPDHEPQSRVPTWNYAVAHLRGELRPFDDEASLAELVDTLSRRHERANGGDWLFDVRRRGHREQLRGIVGFRLQVDDVALKFKLNQNHPAGNRDAVIGHLEALGGDRRRDLTALMRERLHAPTKGD